MATKRFFYIFKEKRNALKLCMKTGHTELEAITTSLSISPGSIGATGATTDRKTDPFYDWMVSLVVIERLFFNLILRPVQIYTKWL